MRYLILSQESNIRLPGDTVEGVWVGLWGNVQLNVIQALDANHQCAGLRIIDGRVCDPALVLLQSSSARIYGRCD